MPVHIAIPEPTSPRFVEDSAAYNQRSLPQYLHALHSAGATPVPIPLHESPQRVARILASVQGILLPGSPADIDPQKYGEAAIPESARADADRASVDELLLQDAFNLHKPILGICQGAQALNTWCGGSLLQDIPTQAGTAVDHSPGRAVSEAHPVLIAPQTRLGKLMAGLVAGLVTGLVAGEEGTPGQPPDAIVAVQVNSSHHQAVRIPGDNLIVAARSPEDNVIEAVELASEAHFVLGVQWHPERTYNESAFSRAIFAAFVHAAQAWTPRRIEESVLQA